MPYCAATDCEVNARVAPGLEALRWHLLDEHYSDAAAFDICWHVLLEGTLAGAPYLEDEADAEAAYCDALPAVPYDDPDWGPVIDHEAAARPGREDWAWLDRDPLDDDDTGEYPAIVPGPNAAAGLVGPDELELIAHEAPDGPDVARKIAGRQGATNGRTLLTAAVLGGLLTAGARGCRAVFGAGPEPAAPAAFEPGPDDLADYAAWSEELDRRRSWDEQTARWNDERWAAGDRPAR